VSSEVASNEAFPVARRRRLGAQWDVLAVVALGGAAGSLLRYGASVAWPAEAGAFPWTTLLINVVGCLAIGVLMFVITEVGAHRLARPFLGVGVLGGFTTFSTYVTDALGLVLARSPGLAVLYLVVTVVTALGAVVAGVVGARALAQYKR
jgi:fluoride exporter